MTVKSFVQLLFLVLAGLFAYFVWPTQYVYYPTGEGVVPHTRVNRITGTIDHFDASGEWVRDGSQPSEVPQQAAPPSVQRSMERSEQARKDMEKMQAVTRKQLEKDDLGSSVVK